MVQLKVKEIDVLIEALTEWEQNLGGVISMTIGGMLLRSLSGLLDDTSSIDEFKREQELKAKRATAEREETSAMLKAKLHLLKKELILQETQDILNKGE